VQEQRALAEQNECVREPAPHRVSMLGSKGDASRLPTSGGPRVKVAAVQ
jgi:hypothetical protein